MARKKRVKRVTKKEGAAVGRKIRKFKEEGLTQRQAIGAAFGHLRQRRKKKK